MIRQEQCNKVCRILDDVLANRPTERDSLIVAVRKAFDALEKQRWIPVAERLPEEYGEYLVTYKSDGEQIFMDIVEYETSFEYDHEKNRFKGNWLFADDCRSVNPEVLTWMPLPELYQKGGAE
jgi:hypothetical protein